MRPRKMRKIRRRQAQIIAEVEALLPVLKANKTPQYYFDKFLSLRSEAAGLKFDLDNDK